MRQTDASQCLDPSKGTATQQRPTNRHCLCPAASRCHSSKHDSQGRKVLPIPHQVVRQQAYAGRWRQLTPALGSARALGSALPSRQSTKQFRQVGSCTNSSKSVLNSTPKPVLSSSLNSSPVPGQTQQQQCAKDGCSSQTVTARRQGRKAGTWFADTGCGGFRLCKSVLRCAAVRVPATHSGRPTAGQQPKSAATRKATRKVQKGAVASIKRAVCRTKFNSPRSVRVRAKVPTVPHACSVPTTGMLTVM